MASLISNKGLWQSLGKIKQKHWAKAGEILKLWVDYKGGKGSHITLRDPAYFPDSSDVKCLIATIQKDLYKEANQSIFKHLLDFKIQENDIWRALKML